MNRTIKERLNSIINMLEDANLEMYELLEDENINEELYDYLDNCKTQVEGATADLIEVSMIQHVTK